MRTFTISLIFVFIAFGTSPKEPGLENIETSKAIKVLLNTKSHHPFDSVVYYFYKDRAFSPIWNLAMAEDLINVLQESEFEGLNTKNYDTDQLANRLMSRRDKNIPAELELLLTSNFVKYLEDLSDGMVNPEEIYPAWDFGPVFFDIWEALCLLSRNPKVSDIVTEFQPKIIDYEQLMMFSKRYSQIELQGGWTPIPEGKELKLGMTGPGIANLKKRLWWTRDLLQMGGSDEYFDCSLQESVKMYQSRNGLTASGIVDEATLASLNIPVSERISQIKLNMERLRWIANNRPANYVLVNIPAFRMEVVNQGEVDFMMRVAVGKKSRKTPVFQATMNRVIFNPYWTVPPSILKKDVLPSMRQDSNYLDNLNINILSLNGDSVGAETIDWQTADGGSFPYLLRQDPGPGNALGKVKFMFPNKFNIYMHDTNHPEIFRGTDLARSSGCIRLSEPMAFAKYLLGDRLPDNVSDNHQIYFLEKDLPVYIVYQTVFIDENGQLNFRDDLYSKDKALIEALQEECGSSSTLLL